MEFKEVLIKDIIPDPNQPRKFFDEHAMDELIASVLEKGVIQPILLRMNKKKQKLMLVCGERRLRASLAVMTAHKTRNTIPAVIRELSDDEALELQIIENLQRKEVHPMEEAVAFKSLLDNGKDLKEIAAKVGKSEFFARQRIKLCSLTDDWQKIFFENRINISEVLKLVLFDADVQKDLLDDVRENEKDIKLNDWMLKKYKGDLESAPFDLNSTTLNKIMGACTNCKYNSATAQLFQDVTKATCSNINCFKTKCDNNFVKALAEAQDDPTMMFVIDEYSDKYSDKFTKSVEQSGFPVMSKYQYSHEELPDKPDFAEFEEEWDYDDGDKTVMEKAFARVMNDYNDDLLQYQKNVDAGKFKNAFMMTGNDRGKFIYISMKKAGSSSPAKATNKTAGADVSATAEDITAEIDRIKTREKRTKEIDQQKIWDELRKQFNPGANASILKGEFTQVEREAIAHTLLSKITYDQNSAFCTLFKAQRIKPDFSNVSEETLRQMTRFFFLNNLPPTTLYSGYSPEALVCLKVANQYFPSVLKEVQDKQDAIAAKRIAKIDKRIGELQKKELATPAAAKKTPAKKSTK